MRNQRYRVVILLLLFVGLRIPLAAQPITESPRLPDGRPDLQGVWDFRTLTPLQRPTERADQGLLTAEEAAEIEANAVKRAVEADQPSEVRTEPLPVGGNVGGYNNYWFDRGATVVGDRRTSLIVEPMDGRLPETRAGVLHQGGDDSDPARIPQRPVRFRVGGIASDGPEDRGLAERCLLGFNTGPPIVPGGYNQNIQIFQTDTHVVILNEMVHDSRIVPLDGRAQLPDSVRQWMGSSRGRWDGDTLVVETMNFTNNTSSFSPSVRTSIGTGATMRLTERFRRLDADTLLYEFTVNDLSSFATPFTAALPMKRGAAPVFEYACHEGNYGMQNLLAGARVEENSGKEQ